MCTIFVVSNCRIASVGWSIAVRVRMIRLVLVMSFTWRIEFKVYKEFAKGALQLRAAVLRAWSWTKDGPFAS